VVPVLTLVKKIMEYDYGQNGAIIGAIIGIVAIITFFVMAWRLGNLANYVKQIGNRLINNPFYEAQMAEVKGKNSEAVEKYIDVLYLVTFTGYRVSNRPKGESSRLIKEKITKLGGTVPTMIKEKNEYL